jgi:hypothetical protein
MAEEFLSLPRAEQLEALGVAATASGRPPYLLEKDVWVVWALAALFEAPFGKDLVFKGGTSLSKGYRAIRRFSEDVDVTYDIRALAPDLVRDAADALPANASQEKKWSKAVRTRLPTWVTDQALPIVQARLSTLPYGVTARAEGDSVLIQYEPLTGIAGYVAPVVRLEFGARSTGEPWEAKPIVCDAAEYVPALAFPTATARVMRVERTFWEKATAIHVYCLQQRQRANRFARHWHDVTRLDLAGYAAAALADRDVAQAVARHKSVFFSEKDVAGTEIDYFAAVSGTLTLVPEGTALDALRDDYTRMAEALVLLDDDEPFDSLIAKCREIQGRANAV